MNEPCINHNGRILVIDDDRDIQECYRDFFACRESESLGSGREMADRPSIPRFDVDSAFQGIEGVAKVERAVAEKHPYSVAIVDLNMPPGWDGLTTIKKLLEIDSSLQIMLITGRDDISWREINQTITSSGQVLLVNKPVGQQELLQLATALSEKWRFGRFASLKAENLSQLVKERGQQIQNALQANFRFFEWVTREVIDHANQLKSLSQQMASGKAHQPDRVLSGALAAQTDAVLKFADKIGDFCKVRSGGYPIQKYAFDVDAICNQVIGALSGMASQNGVQLTFNAASELPAPVWGDPFILQQILNALLENAIRFSSGGYVLVQTRLNREEERCAHIEISIQDSAGGFSQSVLDQIHTHYPRRFDYVITSENRFGIGLRLAFSLTEMIRGKLTIESTEGKGSIVRLGLNLPLAPF